MPHCDERGRVRWAKWKFPMDFRNRNLALKRGVKFLGLSLFYLVFASFSSLADSTWLYAVQISANVQTSPPQITLNWPQDEYGANNYTVYRKAKEDNSWGSGTTLLAQR